MFWIKIQTIFYIFAIITMILVWLIVMRLIHTLYLQDKQKEKTYDINHKTIKDLKVKK